MKEYIEWIIIVALIFGIWKLFLQPKTSGYDVPNFTGLTHEQAIELHSSSVESIKAELASKLATYKASSNRAAGDQAIEESHAALEALNDAHQRYLGLKN